MTDYRYFTNDSIKASTGLIAAYNFIPSKGKLIDISGQGNDGVITGALSSKDGMKFQVDKGAAVLAAPITLSSTTTICIRAKQPTDSDAYFLSKSSSGYLLLNTSDDWYLDDGTANNKIIDNTAFPDGELFDLVITTNGTAYVAYKNGMEIESGTLSNSFAGVLYSISSENYLGRGWNEEIQDLKIYNYAFTAQQAQAYSNSFIKVVLRESFSDSAVGDTI